MKTTNLKWIAYVLSALMLMQSCKVYNGSTVTANGSVVKEKKVKPHKVWVTQMDGTKHKGFLYSVDEDELNITASLTSSGYSIKSNTIKTIKIRRKGKIGNGVLIGAITGLATGGIIGVLSGDDPDKTVEAGWPIGTYTVEGQKKGEKAIIWGITLALVGGGTGAIVASKRNEILINGNIENYKKQLKVLRKYSMNDENK